MNSPRSTAHPSVSGEPFARSWPWWRRWWYAAKPGSWPKLLVPMLLGQALGAREVATPSVAALLGGGVMTIALLCFIVFANDAGDVEVDRIKRRMFPQGCSPKTVPDGVLTRRALVLGGASAGLAALALAWGLAVALERPLLPAWMLASLGLLLAYTAPPLRLYYRGGGELLEMVGVGAVLPALHAYLQAGHIGGALPWVLPGWVCMALASAVASGLSDEVSDRAGGKTTAVTLWGNAVGRRIVERSVMASGMYWAALAAIRPSEFPWWLSASLVVIVWSAGRRLRRLSAGALTNAFAEQGRYKATLHLGIWAVGLLLGLGLWLGPHGGGAG